MNRLTVIGNLTKDAEVKDVSGRKAINMSIAHNMKYKDADGNKMEKSTFYNCTIWRESNVNIAQYLTKGTQVCVEGTPEVEIFKNKEGEMKGAIKIIVANVELLGGGTRKEDNNQPANTSSKKNDSDDLPF